MSPEVGHRLICVEAGRRCEDEFTVQTELRRRTSDVEGPRREIVVVVVVDYHGRPNEYSLPLLHRQQSSSIVGRYGSLNRAGGRHFGACRRRVLSVQGRLKMRE